MPPQGVVAGPRRAAAPDPEVHERVVQLTETVVERVAGWGDLGPALLLAWARDLRKTRALLTSLRKHLTDLLRQGQQRSEVQCEASPEELAMLLIAIVDGLMLQVLVDPAGIPPVARMKRSLRRALIHILSSQRSNAGQGP